jgi:NitT/TauT family transport system substrate-binding protein
MTRRGMLAGGSTFGAGTLFSPALAQTLRPVSFTLSWLAQGPSAFPFVGREKGFFKARGIDLQISRGFGSLAAAQAIAAGRFDFGLVIATPLILLISRGLELQSIGTIDHDPMMGICVLAGSPIKGPRDLAGKKIATVPASAESPFLAAYAQRTGLDYTQLQVVNVDPKVLERVLTEKEVDATTGLAYATLPVLLARNEAARWMTFTSAGIPAAGNNIVTTPTKLKDDAGLCEAFMDAMMESVAFTITNPVEAAEIFVRAVPEAGLAADSRAFIDIGMGLYRYAIAKPIAIEHGLGYGDINAYEALTDLVMQYSADPKAKRPSVEAWYTNRFAGHVKPSKADWDKVVASAAPYAKYLS